LKNDEDHHHSNNKHHHHQQNEILKQQAIGEPWRRNNVPFRKIKNFSNLMFIIYYSTRTDNDRPTQQRSGESSSSGAWRPRTRPTDEPPRDNPRTGPTPAPPTANWGGRSEENDSWRSREKKRLNRFYLFF
jgi:hypothetical protein